MAKKKGRPVPEKKEASAPRKEERILIVSDLHFPYVHAKTFGCILGIAREWQPTTIVDLGDHINLDCLSRHPKSRPDTAKLRNEFEAGERGWDALLNVCNPNKKYQLQGNHEYRTVSFVNEWGFLDGLLQPEEMMHLKEKGIIWVPSEEQPLVLGSHSAYHHGDTATSSTYHARSHAEVTAPAKAPGRILFYGHFHTFQCYTHPNGQTAQGCGYGGDVRQLKYTKNRASTWRHGVILQTVDVFGNMSYQTVEIKNGRAAFVKGQSVTVHSNTD